MADLSSVQCVTKASFDPSTLTSAYQPLNGLGFSDDVKIMKLYNGSTTVAIDISLDGFTDNDFMPPLGTLIVDFQAGHADNSAYGSGTLCVRKGQILYGKIASNANFVQIVGYR